MSNSLTCRFNYKSQLLQNLTSSEAKVVNIFNQTVMKGENGVVASVNLTSFNGKVVLLDMI